MNLWRLHRILKAKMYTLPIGEDKILYTVNKHNPADKWQREKFHPHGRTFQVDVSFSQAGRRGSDFFLDRGDDFAFQMQ